ncbi:type II toxin-antitoxin system toxin DNA ADP-ribosyl transferase DarT [Dactylosporangium sp. CA-052675]|uniref:type II toxin-antitoxin system toxin DNA ADP-ribosyl transferase DarT n=1 Tax=Dactylosporangium sp. CA-052675 TaxID=3239927 RepID=UPI003D9447CF
MSDHMRAARDHRIYHFTHLDNMSEIHQVGRLMGDAAARQGHMRREVGDPAIKEARRRRVLPLPPGGRVGDYVPFYYAPRSPMMFRIACDHRDGIAGRYPGGDRPLVYLVSSVGAIVDAGLTWLATDGNAATATTEFTADLGRLHDMIDWPLMVAERWNNTEDDPDRQRRRMAEFLVHQQVPLSAIRWLATYSEFYAARLRETLGDHELTDRIIVRPSWYYGYEQRRGGVR